LPGSSNASDAIVISLVSPTDDGQVTTVSKFHPKFTYSIFGDEERIFGYQKLHINLRYNANDMRPHLGIQYKKKFKAVGETEPDDLQEALKEYLPEGMFPFMPSGGSVASTNSS
jgi:histone acetyltransferase 1